MGGSQASVNLESASNIVQETSSLPSSSSASSVVSSWTKSMNQLFALVPCYPHLLLSLTDDVYELGRPFSTSEQERLCISERFTVRMCWEKSSTTSNRLIFRRVVCAFSSQLPNCSISFTNETVAGRSVPGNTSCGQICPCRSFTRLRSVVVGFGTRKWHSERFSCCPHSHRLLNLTSASQSSNSCWQTIQRTVAIITILGPARKLEFAEITLFTCNAESAQNAVTLKTVQITFIDSNGNAEAGIDGGGLSRSSSMS